MVGKGGDCAAFASGDNDDLEMDSGQVEDGRVDTREQPTASPKSLKEPICVNTQDRPLSARFAPCSFEFCALAFSYKRVYRTFNVFTVTNKHIHRCADVQSKVELVWVCDQWATLGEKEWRCDDYVVRRKLRISILDEYNVRRKYSIVTAD